MTKRRRWLLVHRINGLLLGIFVTVVGLTGSLLAWNAQLERVFAPKLFILPPHPVRAVRANPLFVRAQVAIAFPWAEVNDLDLSTFPDAPLQFSLGSNGRNQRDDEAFADPYTGRILGSRRSGDLRQGWVNFMPFVDNLHENLALGDFGMVLLGIAALLWTIDCFIGIYLTFPASHKRVTPSRRVRAARWPLRWRASWVIRWRAGAFKRLYDVHRAFGLWFWVLLLVFAWTGVAFNLPAVYNPVMRLAGAEKPPSAPSGLCSAGTTLDSSSWGGGLEEARAVMQQQTQQRHVRILAERFLSYDPATCRWTYRVRSTRDVDRIGNTQLVWVGSASAQAIFTAPTGATYADTFTTWIEAIHESQIGGNGFRIMVCLSGLISALLAITGVWIFLRKVIR